MKNRTTRKFTGNILQIIMYLLSTYRKISPIHLNYIKKEVTDMHYDPVTPVDNIFNKIEDILEYGDMENCPYSQLHAISKAYNIVNKTGKFRGSIKYWNCFPLIQKTWIAFKTNLREAHLELTKTVELTLGESGYGKANLVEDIVSRLSAEFQYQANMVNGTPPKDPAPPITGTIELLQQVLVHNQELMRLISDKYGKSGRKNTSRPPTHSTGPC